LLPTIHCPARHVFGEVDSLVPIAAAEKISALNSDHQIMKLYSRAHLLHFPEEEFIHIANSFYTKYI